MLPTSVTPWPLAHDARGRSEVAKTSHEGGTNPMTPVSSLTTDTAAWKHGVWGSPIQLANELVSDVPVSLVYDAPKQSAQLAQYAGTLIRHSAKPNPNDNGRAAASRTSRGWVGQSAESGTNIATMLRHWSKLRSAVRADSSHQTIDTCRSAMQ